MKDNNKTKYFKALSVHLFAVVIAAGLFSAPAFVLAANVYENNPASCPTNYQAQTCLGNTVLCGYSGGIVYCYDKTTLSGNVPSGDTTTSSAPATISINGGYIVDCASYDSAAPYCDNSGNFICNADNTYYNTDHVQTTCNGTHWASDGASAYTYGSCLSGYQDCNSSPNTCEVHNGVTSYPGGYAHATYAGVQSACTPACMPGYYDCNSGGSGPASGDGCETQNNTSSGACASPATWVCTQTGSSCWGQDGTQTYSCTCTYAKNNFQAATLNEYSSSSGTPLLWGKEDGTDNLIQFANSSTPSLFTVDSYGNLATAGTGTSSFTGKLSVNSTITNVISSTSGVAQIGTPLTLGTHPEGIAVSGRYAYVTNYNSNTMSVVDISNPSSPSVVSTTSVGTLPKAVAVAGRYAYVANYGTPSASTNTVAVVDISNPYSPSVVGTLSFATAVHPSWIAISGHYAYLSNYSANNFSIVDISNPASPTLVVNTAIGGGTNSSYSLAVSGRYAYILNYLASPSILSVVDISNPSSPSVAGTLTFSVTHVDAIALSGRYAYVTNTASNSMSVVDISNPASPSLVPGGTVSVGSSPEYLALSGRYAYVTNFSSANISIVDISNPSSPTVVATPSVGAGPSYIALSGRYAYVTNYTPNTLSVLDLAGSEMGSLYASSLETGELQTTKNIVAQGNIMGDSLLAGQNGVFSTGPITSSGAGTFGSLSVVGGSYHTNFQGQTQSQDLTYTFPGAYPAASGYALSSDTSGTLSWVPASPVPALPTYSIQYNNGSNTFGGFGIWNGTTMDLGAGTLVAGGTVSNGGYMAVGGSATANSTINGAGTPGWLGGWSYRKQITISNANVGENFSNFPLLVKLTNDSDIGTGVSDTTHGYDIRFADSSGNLLPYQRESFSVSSGQATANFWVQMPAIYHTPSGTQNIIYIYYGNSFQAGTDWTAVGSPTKAQSVWTNGYAGVWHLDSPTNPIDSTGINSGTDHGATATAGQIDGAGSFDGTDSYINIPNPSNLNSIQALTVSTWIEPSISHVDYERVVDKGYNTAFSLNSLNNNQFGLSIGNSINSDGIFTTGPLDNTWHHLVATADGTTLRLYVDGVLNNSKSQASPIGSDSYPLTIGADMSTYPNNEWFNGSIDEVRVSTVARDASWIKFEYCNQTVDTINCDTGSHPYEMSFSSQQSGSSQYTGGIAMGLNAVASGSYQTVFGQNNVPDTSSAYAFILGNGGATVSSSTCPTSCQSQGYPGMCGSMVNPTCEAECCSGGCSPNCMYMYNCGGFTPWSTCCQPSFQSGICSGCSACGTSATKITVTKTISSPANAVTVDWSGNLTTTSSITNLTTSKSPVVQVGNVATGANTMNPAVSGRYVYTTQQGPSTMTIVDVSKPSAPVVVGVAKVGAVPNNVNANPIFVAVSGRYAYVANSTDSSLSSTGSMSVVDVSNPHSPVQISYVTIATNPVAIAISGHYAYLANGTPNLMTVVNISNPYLPVVVANVTVGTNPWDIAVQGRYAYVTNQSSNSVSVVDISNPASPTVVGTVTGFNGIRGIAASGRYAYVTNFGGNSVSVIDVSNPASPTVVGTASGTGSLPFYIAVSGHYVYTSNNGDGMTIVDISNPTSPTVVENVTLASQSYPWGIAVSGRYAYFANAGGSLSIVDISGVEMGSAYASSTETGELQVTKNIVAQGNIMGDSLLAGQNGIISTGSLAVSTTTVPSYFGGKLGINTTSPISTLNVDGTITNIISSTSGSAQISTATVGTNPEGIAVSGRYAYVANYTSGTMSVVDISNSSSPIAVSTTTVGNNPRSVAVSGRYAYVLNYGTSTSDSSLAVVDVSNPHSPTVTGSLATTGLRPTGIVISGRYAYLANYNTNSFSIIDISNPASPTLIISTAVGGGTNQSYSLAVSGHYAYILDWKANPSILSVVDISNPHAPSTVGSLTFTGVTDVNGIAVSGRYAYVTNDASASMSIVDISNPASPSLVTGGTVTVGTTPKYVAVSGRYAYVTNYGSANMSIVDVSNPSSPVVVATVTVGTNPMPVAVSGRYAYVANYGSNTISVVQISGAEMGSLYAGSLETGELQATKNIIAQGNIIGDSLLAGQNGIFSTGPITIPITTIPSYFGDGVGIAGGRINNGGYLAVGGGAIASGTGSIAMGYSTNATGTYSIAIGNAVNAVGADSIAMGYLSAASGNYSTAMGNATNAVGTDSIAMGYLSAASGNYSAAIGYNAAASGINSTAMGIDTTASGNNSTAMGNSTNATGTDSTAMGNSTNATGDYSTAMGHGAGATGDNSTAMGFATTAQGYDQTVIGTNNILQGTKSSKASTDYALIIGNGVPGTPSDALTVDWSGNVNIPSISANYYINGVLLNPNRWIISGSNIYYNLGNVGIGTSSPAGGKLNVAAASGSQNAAFFNTNDWDGVSNGSGLQIAFGASSGNTYSELNPLTAGGGNVGNLVLNANYVGVGQTSPGYKLDVNGTANATEYCISGSNCITSWPGIPITFSALEVASGTLGGTGIMAVGYGSVASEAGGGSGSIAMGYNVTSNGNYTFATGAGTTASSQFSTAMGSSTTASGYSSFAEGENSQATNIFDVAMGNHNTASGGSSVALGGGTAASGIFSTATGEYTTASGDNSTAMGFGTTAQGYVQTVIGESNAATGTASTKVSTDYAFIIGNGVYGSYNSDALAVNWNGDLYLGGTSHSNAFDVAEDYSTKDSTLSPGEIVALDTSNPLFVVRADSSNSPVILGIVSTDPGVELGETKAFLTEAKASAGGPTVPVALSGRVPTKVNLEGGAISVGDRITLSSTPGVGMKAPAGSDSIGFALEPFDGGGNTPAAGTINVFVQNQQYDAILGLSVDGTVGSGTINFSKNINVNTITAASARVNDLEMVTANGDVYCRWIDDNGNWQKVKGDCATVGPTGTPSSGQ